MVKEMIISASAISLNELLSQTILVMYEAQHAAKKVLFQRENFGKFSVFLEKISVILKELLKLNIECDDSLKDAVEMLNLEVKVSKQLAIECVAKNRVYLLVNCRKIIRCLDDCTNGIGRALSLIPIAYADLPLRVNNQIKKLCKGMLDAEYQIAKVEEEIMEKIELGIQERNADRSYANYMLVSVAEAIGISSEQSELKREFQEFKKETEEAMLGKDVAEGIYMEQVVSLLEKADAITSEVENEIKYFEKQNGLGRQPLEPLRSFYCPITQEVMEDPVETSSGITFERHAIEKWLSEGNDRCPLTNLTLDNMALRPNRILRKSIEEWKDRNTMITIASIKTQLQSHDSQEVLRSLGQLHDLCLERELHCEWITMEDYTPILIGLLGSKDREIRKSALLILCTLAKYSDRNKERIARVENALKSIVRSLARQIGESKLAAQLLVELSRSNEAQEFIGTIQGCIFLVVTMLSSKDVQAAKYAQELLDNLSFHEQNVIQMAKANYFRPLLQLLSSGPINRKMVMAEALSKLELIDHHKLSLFRDGALGPLLQLLSDDDLEVKKVGIKALHNLSNVPQNGLQMIREGAVEPLFELLYRHSLSWPSLRQQVAAIIMHLAISTAAQNQEDHNTVRLIQSDDDIFRFFCLISLTGPEIQQNILRAFHAMCQAPCGLDIRIKLRQLSAVQVLVQLCEVDNHSVRANAIKLFCCLTEDGDDSTFLEHVGQRCVETLLRVITTSNDVEEISAAMAIITNLPKDQQISNWLLDASVLQTIYFCLTGGNREASHQKQVTENAVGALCHFTVSTNPEWQTRVAEAGLIHVLVQLLHSGTTLTKKNAAISLKQLSESSTDLSKPLVHRGIFWCCMAAPETGCPIHAGTCSVETSFCILEANAVDPLVKLLGESDFGVCEASLDALLTLIDDERLQSGAEVLEEANAISPIVKMLSSPCARLQEKTLKTLERIFRLVELKQKYGASAQMPLVDITQRGSNVMKSLAAKVLSQLDVLGEQSSYF